MKKTLSAVLIAFGIASVLVTGVEAADTVSGSLTLAGKKTTFTHAYSQWAMKELRMARIVLADAAVPAEALADYAKLREFSAQKKVTILDFGAAPTMALKIINPTIYAPALANGIDQVPATSPGTLTVKSFKGDRLAATWSSDGEKKTMSDGVTHAFEVTFDVAVR